MKQPDQPVTDALLLSISNRLGFKISRTSSGTYRLDNGLNVWYVKGTREAGARMLSIGDESYSRQPLYRKGYRVVIGGIKQ